MTAHTRVRVYMACSLDGFIAGPNNELDWLTADHGAPGDLESDPAAIQFPDFLDQVGVMLMGRTTYDAVESMGEWPYGAMPVVVATRRPLSPVVGSVKASEGSISTLIDECKSQAGTKDVYLDGGNLVQQALNAGLVDEIIATFIPVLLGKGVRLFDGLIDRHALQFVAHAPLGGGLLQVTAKVRRPN